MQKDVITIISIYAEYYGGIIYAQQLFEPNEFSEEKTPKETAVEIATQLITSDPYFEMLDARFKRIKRIESRKKDKARRKSKKNQTNLEPAPPAAVIDTEKIPAA
ncbi:MAG: hypothetical protein ACM3KR_11445 [Deltaproteobacteria bacterium]